MVCAGDTYEGLCKAMRGSRSMICCAKVHSNVRAIINPLIMVYAIKTGCSLCMGKLQRTNDHMMWSIGQPLWAQSNRCLPSIKYGLGWLCPLADAGQFDQICVMSCFGGVFYVPWPEDGPLQLPHKLLFSYQIIPTRGKGEAGSGKLVLRAC